MINLEKAYMARQLVHYFDIFLRYSTPKKIGNLIQCEYELFMKRSRLKSMPYAVKLEPTNICNLQCVFCDRKKVNYGEGMMSFENFRKVFDQLKDHLYFCALELWGEPLLHKDICQIINYAHKNKVATYVSTNLNFLNKNLEENFISSGLDLLSVAVDGATQETYNLYRKNGNFNLVVENLKKLVAQKRKMKSKTPIIELQFIVFRYNEHEVEKIKELAEEIGVDSLKLRPGVVSDKTWIPRNKKFRSKQYVNKRKNRKVCWWLWRTASIAWNGQVFPCCRRVFKKPFGNMLEEKFLSIWNNEIYIDSRKCFSSKKKRYSPCYACEIPFGSLHA